MKRYSVRVPITGYAEVSVMAEDERGAIQTAVARVTQDDVTEFGAGAPGAVATATESHDA